MGLLLLIPGLLFLLNGVTWFEGEENIGKWLVIIGGGLIALQVVIMLVMAMFGISKTKSIRRDFNDW